MDLVKKELEFEINNERFIMTFDMKSIATYKELSGEPFVLGEEKLKNFDDEAIINFIASTLRRKEEPDKPLGLEVINGDLVFYLFELTGYVIYLVNMSLPEAPKESKKKEEIQVKKI
ncbi:hypothetical protein ACFO6R_05930 [Eubacterium multiforme]|uniref:Uncharacterized protein n=1 Tax=Eubacterium multiforme TaxID=83339 RepID=A0ABT9US50_9FIRM|nr:hypothetical protein [Eubacterium multiforme]MDQ0149123.1 hypothetical protein [Eubacterium multiforme]